MLIKMLRWACRRKSSPGRFSLSAPFGSNPFLEIKIPAIGRDFKLALAVGFEPTADRLTADCSTTELRQKTIE